MNFRKSLIRKIISGGQYVNGNWVEGSKHNSTITASVQPIDPHQIELLPEARRDSKSYEIFTNTNLNSVESQNPDQNPDIIVIDDEEYEVVMKSPWQNNVINHYSYIVVKI